MNDETTTAETDFFHRSEPIPPDVTTPSVVVSVSSESGVFLERLYLDARRSYTRDEIGTRIETIAAKHRQSRVRFRAVRWEDRHEEYACIASGVYAAGGAR
jgi:hypothetical protein